MKQWKIVADSICDIRTFDQLPAEVDYQYVPLYINISDQTYIDNEDLDLMQFQDILDEATEGSTTACSSPEQYATAFEGAEKVICFTVSSEVSGSYNSAMLGAQMAREKNPDLEIHVVDTKTASSEMNLLARKAVELAKSNPTFDEMVNAINDYRQHTNISYILQSVTNLVNNGRIPRLLGSMIGLLNIFLIGERTPEGTIDLAHRTRGARRAIKTLIKSMIDKGYQGGRVEIAHSFNEKDANEITKQILKEFPNADITLIPMGGLAMFYAEKNGIIVGYEVK